MSDIERAEDKVRAMEEAGFSVEVQHCRVQPLDEVLPKGGVTVCQVLIPEGQGESVFAVGHAYCREDENFVRRIGFEIAVGRAYKEWEEHRAHA
jgi:hypothetical protein